MALHSGADKRHLADEVVEQDLREIDLRLQGRQLLHGARAVRLGQREGDVGLAGLDLGDVLQNHVDVDLGLGDGAEDLGGVTRRIGQADDGDLGLAAVVCDTGDQGFFHGMSSIDPDTIVPGLVVYDERTCTGTL